MLPTTQAPKRPYDRIIEDLNSSKGSKKRRASQYTRTPLEALRHEGRWIPRALGPFVPVHAVVGLGAAQENGHNGDALYAHLTPKERQEYLKLYDPLLSIISGVKRDMAQYREDPESFARVLDMMTGASNQGRTDDIGTIKERVLCWISFVPGFPPILADTVKIQRGLKSVHCARMLCPVNLLPEFDVDQAAFMAKYEEGRMDLTADDFPAFLWDATHLDPDNLEAGLLRSQVMLKAARAIYTGPDSAKSPLPGYDGGKRPPLIIVYRAKLPVQKFTPEMVAYVAVLVRFSLSSQNTWSGREGTFCYEAFFKNIVDLFKNQDREWCKETLQWYQLWIFNRPNAPTFAPICDLLPKAPQEGSSRALLLGQLAQEGDGEPEV
ncbi:hypothetical protein PsYK624_086760 [Phanerochaete sordida]|uniref:Uncharacterized protein n=1 Tax=Phanerochaete sordida TaxID=48140 RepID=A0A9P3GD67_9APHY|nr:hypothetical protein PsYK624_086760 [Phanerochaete sordida]